MNYIQLFLHSVHSNHQYIRPVTARIGLLSNFQTKTFLLSSLYVLLNQIWAISCEKCVIVMSLII